jgi:hypothetical protein
MHLGKASLTEDLDTVVSHLLADISGFSVWEIPTLLGKLVFGTEQLFSSGKPQLADDLR